MSDKSRLIGLLAAGALALACDSTGENSPRDSRAPAADTWSVPIPDVGQQPDRDGGLRDVGGSDLRDAGLAEDAPPVPVDQGEPGLTCAQILQCRENCPPEQSCLDDCLAQGSPTAQQQHAALAQCVRDALTGSCAASCSDVASAACSACWQAACKTELDACTPP